MSGECFSSGKLTNKGEKKLDIIPYLNSKIDSINLYIMLIQLNTAIDIAKEIEVHAKLFLHPAICPNISHVAIQLNMENKDLFLIEYGQYLTKDSEKENLGIFSLSDNIESSNNPRKENNDVDYYYINKDGVRISKLSFKLEGDLEELNKKSITEISTKFYGITVEEFQKINHSKFNKFHVFLCKINNKIKLKELFSYFEGKKEWEAQGYNVATHNCQDFAAEIIKILKAERIDESLKIRMNEKVMLPNCIIKAFWENEEWSMTNTLGRIPIFGFFYDIVKILK